MTNNQTLYNLHNEIQNWQYSGSALALFLRSKIREFYRHNGIRINTLIEKLEAIGQEHFVRDEKGEMLYDGEGENRKPLMLEGKTLEDYQKARTELMSQEVVIKL